MADTPIPEHLAAQVACSLVDIDCNATVGVGADRDGLQDQAMGRGPISDDELEKITVGERKAHNAPITLTDYDPRMA